MYKPPSDLQPRSEQECYRRAMHYAHQMGEVSSAQLKQALLALRKAAPQLSSPDLQEVAGKEYSQSEFTPAAKELLCIWIHLEALDQGGPLMDSWLMQFLEVALAASDNVIEEPSAAEVLETHSRSLNDEVLCTEVSETMSLLLGFAHQSANLAPILLPLLSNSRPVRQKILEEALSAPLDSIA